MQELYIAAAMMGSLTLAFGTVLAIAARYLSVYEDPRIAETEAQLGGTNCGACGKPGCHAFALALLAGEAAPAQCTVISAEAASQLAEQLGVEAGQVQRMVARLHCHGGHSAVPQLARYTGEASCKVAHASQRGGRACAYGCLGFGDCADACEFDAIAMNDESLPVVAPDRCTACGDCVEACPANLFTLEPLDQHVVVQCSSPLVGEAALSSCRVACDACGRCALDATPGAIVMEHGLPRLRRPRSITEVAVQRCPTGAIAWVEDAQLAFDVPVSALRRHHG